MHVTVSLSSAVEWSWQLRDDGGNTVAVGCATFSSYALAMANATETCRLMVDAPIHFQPGGLTAPALAPDAQVALTSRMEPVFQAFSAMVQTRGIDAALQFLNGRITHRYTGLYRLADQRLVNVVLVDKLEKVCPPNLASVPYNQSFCQFAIRDGQFRTENSACDTRLDGHPYQGVLNTYHAFPLVSAEGQVLGTICHFDTAALSLDDENFELLRLAAQVVGRHLPQEQPATERDGRGYFLR